MQETLHIDYRPLLPGDSIARIAKYLFLTDPYIYPDIASSPSDPHWIRLTEQWLATEHCLFSADHFIVAVCDRQIIGLACAVPCGQLLHIPTEAYPQTPQAQTAYTAYLAPLLHELQTLQGTYISNLCVDPLFRGLGVGWGLLQAVAEHHTGRLTLDVLADNFSALHLYKSCGYQVTDQFYGYSGYQGSNVICLKMVNNR